MGRSYQNEFKDAVFMEMRAGFKWPIIVFTVDYLCEI